MVEDFKYWFRRILATCTPRFQLRLTKTWFEMKCRWYISCQTSKYLNSQFVRSKYKKACLLIGKIFIIQTKISKEQRHKKCFSWDNSSTMFTASQQIRTVYQVWTRLAVLYFNIIQPNSICSCPSFDWWYNILILVRGTGIPMYYSYPHSAGRNNVPARRLVCNVARRKLVCKFFSLV